MSNNSRQDRFADQLDLLQDPFWVTEKGKRDLHKILAEWIEKDKENQLLIAAVRKKVKTENKNGS